MNSDRKPPHPKPGRNRKMPVVSPAASSGAFSAEPAAEKALATDRPENAAQKPGKTVALTLGSGGARGYAHIGAIEILQERGYEIVAVSGCSMGALIGGFYAAGKLQDYKDWVTGLGQFDVLRLLDVTFNSIGAIRGEKIFSVVREMLGDTRIEDLPIPYTAVATDLLAHKEVWFQEGPLDQAIRASVAIPSVVTPLVLNGRVLVDGALLNPLPIIPTISAHADLIVAVNLSGEDDQRQRIPDTAMVTDNEIVREIEEWVDMIRVKASRWFDWDTLRALGPRKGEKNGDETAPAQAGGDSLRQSKEKTHQDDGPPRAQVTNGETIDWDKLGIGRFDIMNLTIETMQSALIQYKIAGYPPDLLVNIPKNACRSYDYHKAPELIQLGRERMAAALDRYERDRNSSGPLAIE